MLINLAQTQPQLFIVLIFSLILALTFHEFAHAYVAYLCGDPTAKMMGRMNINPLAHLDLFGSLMLLFVGFGYAKPVPVNPRNFRTPKGDLYVSAAGPGMNFLLGFLGALIFWGCYLGNTFQNMHFPLHELLYLFILINFNLGLFNLIPLGPLDGSYVLPYMLSFEARRRYEMWNAQYGTYVLIGAFMLSWIAPSLSPFRWLMAFSRGLMQLILP